MRTATSRQSPGPGWLRTREFCQTAKRWVQDPRPAWLDWACKQTKHFPLVWLLQKGGHQWFQESGPALWRPGQPWSLHHLHYRFHCPHYHQYQLVPGWTLQQWVQSGPARVADFHQGTKHRQHHQTGHPVYVNVELKPAATACLKSQSRPH